MLRLDKYLADCGAGTRSEVKKILKAGRVTVDGAVCLKPETKVSPEDSEICLDGKRLSYKPFAYYLLHKPAGVITATEDPRHRTVMDLLTGVTDRDLAPVGRLDIDTEGLLLITNDGALAHRLLSPKHHVDKTYYARISGHPGDETVLMFREGLVLPDGLSCMPAELRILTGSGSGSDDYAEILITIREGKFHQIKRMFQAVGCEVLYLKRLTMGPLTLDENLQPGEYRRLTDAELDTLRKV